MFMHKSKKGFTIVELVIVIAVIAILAAVLIPTFSNLVKKANMSADQQAVRQMNTVLAAEIKIEDGDQAKQALKEAGYNSAYTLVPTSEGHFFFFVKDLGKVVLTDKDLKIVYPQIDGYTGNPVPDGSWNLVIGLSNTIADTPEKFVEHINANTSEIALTTNAEVDTPISLNGKTINVATGATLEAPQVTVEGSGSNLTGEGTIKTNIVAKVAMYIGGTSIKDKNYPVKLVAADNNKPLISATEGWGAITVVGGELEGETIFEVDGSRSVTIEGGKFNGKPYDQMTEQEWKDICAGDYYISGAGTSSVLIMKF